MRTLKRQSSQRPLVGLDIEPGAIHAAQVKVNGGLSIAHAASAGLEPGVVRDGEIADVDALAAALKDLFSEHKLDKRVRIGVANQRSVVRQVLLPPISDAKELATAVHFQAESELPMPVDQAVLQHVDLGVVDSPSGPRQRVLLVAARRDMIERFLSAAQLAGLKPEGIDLSAFGMIRALPAGDALVMHLSVSGLTNLAITRGGQCAFTRVVAHGIESMAAEVAARQGISVAEARAALVESGLAGLQPEDDGLAAACRAALGDGVNRIAGDVRNSIDFHASGGGTAGEPVERILLTGRALAVPGFAAALEAAAGLPVEVADVAGADPAAPGSHAVAAGLAVAEAVA